MPRRMPSFGIDPWESSKAWLQPAIARSTQTAEALGIIPAAAAAYAHGIRTPLARAGHVAKSRPWTRRGQSALEYLSDPRRVDPGRAIQTLKGYGAAPFWEYYKQQGLALPQLEQFRQFAPLLYGASESAAGRLIGPGGIAVPPEVWRAARRGVQRARQVIPGQLARGEEMVGGDQYGSVGQMLMQFLRGRGISLGDIAKEIIPSLTRG